MNDVVPIIICIPASAVVGQLKTAYSQYVKVKCPSCGEDMWLGERGKKLIDDNKAFMMCGFCAIKAGILTENSPMQKLTDSDKK